MKIYQVTITPQTISDKNTLRKAVPLLIWLVVFFIALGLMCATENLIFFIPFAIMCIIFIPFAIWSLIRGRRIHREALAETDITVIAENGEIYKDNIKLNIQYNSKNNIVYLDNMRREGRFNFFHFSFAATIHGYKAIEFIHFCRENGINVNFKS